MAGKIIAITGASGGLGRALAERFVADGEQVVLLGRSLDKVRAVAEPLGERAVPVVAEMTSPESIRAAFTEIKATHGRLDVLINSAAVFNPFLVTEASDEQITTVVLTNLAGPIVCAREAIPLMGRGGHIINLSSESVDVPFPHLTLYQATKAGLERFGHHLQAELDEQGIRVTTVRAGQMMGEEFTMTIDVAAMQRMMEAAAKRGLDLAARGITQYRSTLDLFRGLVDLPADIHVGLVSFNARVPGA